MRGAWTDVLRVGMQSDIQRIVHFGLSVWEVWDDQICDLSRKRFWQRWALAQTAFARRSCLQHTSNCLCLKADSRCSNHSSWDILEHTARTISQLPTLDRLCEAIQVQVFSLWDSPLYQTDTHKTIDQHLHFRRGRRKGKYPGCSDLPKRISKVQRQEGNKVREVLDTSLSLSGGVRQRVQVHNQADQKQEGKTLRRVHNTSE